MAEVTIYDNLKRNLAQTLKAGHVSEETKEKLRAGIKRHPHELGSLARFL